MSFTNKLYNLDDVYNSPHIIHEINQITEDYTVPKIPIPPSPKEKPIFIQSNYMPINHDALLYKYNEVINVNTPTLKPQYSIIIIFLIDAHLTAMLLDLMYMYATHPDTLNNS